MKKLITSLTLVALFLTTSFAWSGEPEEESHSEYGERVLRDEKIYLQEDTDWGGKFDNQEQRYFFYLPSEKKGAGLSILGTPEGYYDIAIHLPEEEDGRKIWVTGSKFECRAEEDLFINTHKGHHFDLGSILTLEEGTSSEVGEILELLLENSEGKIVCEVDTIQGLKWYKFRLKGIKNIKKRWIDGGA